MKKIRFVTAMIVVLLIIAVTMVSAAQMPPFLPEYYSPVFEGMVFVDKKSTDNRSEQYMYESADRSIILSIENIKTDRPGARAILHNSSFHLNSDHIKNKNGALNVIGEKEVNVEFQENQVEQSIYAFDTGKGLQVLNVFWIGVGIVGMFRAVGF